MRRGAEDEGVTGAAGGDAPAANDGTESRKQ